MLGNHGGGAPPPPLRTGLQTRCLANIIAKQLDTKVEILYLNFGHLTVYIQEKLPCVLLIESLVKYESKTFFSSSDNFLTKVLAADSQFIVF